MSPESLERVKALGAERRREWVLVEADRLRARRAGEEGCLWLCFEFRARRWVGLIGRVVGGALLHVRVIQRSRAIWLDGYTIYLNFLNKKETYSLI